VAGVSDTSAYETILYEINDGIATVTLKRPDKLNLFTVAMMRELIDAIDHADADDEVRVIIFTGAGKAFCGGADVSSGEDAFKRKPKPASADAPAKRSVPRDGGGMLALRMYHCNKPIIGAINGVAAGVGATMILPMDVRMCSTTARFGYVFAKRGMTVEACASWFLPRIVGISKAAEWIYSGRVFDAQEALAGGLVRSVHEPAELLPAARALAAELAAGAPVAVALLRQMLWRMLGAPHPMEAHRAESRGMYIVAQGPDVREGIRAFLAKETPDFPGKVSTDLPDLFPDWVEPEYS
jgi:enoyl-CoA hydratase/carnithine racemase